MQPLLRRIANPERNPWPDRPVPIALVITELDPGGAEKALVTLATRLDRARWNPSVVALGPEAELCAILRQNAIETVCLDVNRRRPIAAIARLAKALRKIRPQLVQSYLFHANLAAKLAGPLAGRPWIVGGLRVAEKEQRWHLRLDRATQQLSLGAVCVSRGVRDFSIGNGLDPQRLLTIPNGVDPAVYARAEPIPKAHLGLVERAKILLFVGRITPQKGVDGLITAFARLAPIRPEWHLVLVGDGPLRMLLERRTHDDPALKNRVHWLGRRGDVPRLVRTADLFVLPSLWEGMPNALMEAMAAGLPVVATGVEGSQDLVTTSDDIRTGWLVHPGDSAELFATLTAATDPAMPLPEIGQRGRERVDRGWTWVPVVKRYESLWASILGLNPDS